MIKNVNRHQVRPMITLMALTTALMACATGVKRPPVDPTQQQGMTAVEVEGHIQACMQIAQESTGDAERTADAMRVAGGALLGGVLGGVLSDDTGKGVAAGAAAGGATTAGVGLMTAGASRADVIVIECLQKRGITVLGAGQ